MTWTVPRTWVTGELVTATLFNSYVRDNMDAMYTRLAYTGVPIGSTPGHSYRTGGGTWDTFDIGVDLGYVFPLWAPKKVRIVRVGLNVNSAGSFAELRCGVYYDTRGRPAKLKEDWGSFDASGTGFKYLDIDTTFEPGPSWIMVGAVNDDVTVYGSYNDGNRYSVPASSLTFESLSNYRTSDDFSSLSDPIDLFSVLTPVTNLRIVRLLFQVAA